MMRGPLLQATWLILLASAALSHLGANAVRRFAQREQRAMGAPAAEPHANSEDSSNGGAPVYALPEFYHSYDSMQKELRALGKSCGLSVHQATLDGVTVDYFHLKESPNPSERLFLLPGDHPRELVAPEVVFAFLKALCSGQEAPEGYSAEALRQKLHVMAVLAVSVPARRAGAYCMRSSPRGVDFNRNWGQSGDSAAAAEKDHSKYPRAPQQPEVQILISLLSQFQPTVFVSVHSGRFGVYTSNEAPSGDAEKPPSTPSDAAGPPGHLQEAAEGAPTTAGESREQQIAGVVHAAACSGNSVPCEFGSIDKFFEATGNEIDFVKAHLTTDEGEPPVALALEVYRQGNSSNEDAKLKEAKAQLLSLLRAPEDLLELTLPAAADVADLLPQETGGEDALYTAEALIKWQLTRGPLDRLSCFLSFNPATQSALNSVVRLWVEALFALAESL
ncbi:hypothetical protein, conserved [Eimeria necatrix]|uniref:Peptidase M14 domain-containing protein n=1 Tax=Eimeria necatrix TaxID=51315 RepID=U6MLU2_9EIME|nr:hypothetical protein, conserved [Eimeria necatrix]CDJ65207.1 hypothetical protein, conserved [Eimeria necatrix]